MTTWRPCEGFKDTHEISEHGQVRRLRTGRILWFYADPRSSYCRITMSAAGTRRFYPVHRLVLLTFGGPQPTPLHECNHKDGNRLNNHISNLEWVTRSENIKHAYDVLNRPRNTGVKHGMSKLNDADVTRIRIMRSDGASLKMLANEFNCTIGNICAITKGWSWKHLLPSTSKLI